MKSAIWVMLCNALIEVTFIVCVTLAAIHFEKPSMCWWYVLVLFLGYSVKTKQDDDDKSTIKEAENERL